MDTCELELPDPGSPASMLLQECWDAAGMSTTATDAPTAQAPAGA